MVFVRIAGIVGFIEITGAFWRILDIDVFGHWGRNIIALV